MERNTKIIHSRYGTGLVIFDVESLCKEGEVLVRFDNGLPSTQSAHSERSLHQSNYIEIVEIKDLAIVANT